jgi:hypothetical protein
LGQEFYFPKHGTLPDILIRQKRQYPLHDFQLVVIHFALLQIPLHGGIRRWDISVPG